MGVAMARFFEELFPFFSFLRFYKKKISEANDHKIGDRVGHNSRYYLLTQDQILIRLKEEHARAKAMDEKTIKFTLAVSLGLTLIEAISIYISNLFVPQFLQLIIQVVLGVAIVYSIIGGLLALGALRTLPTFGYGTEFLLQANDDEELMVYSLLAQEKINVIRQLRNESAYMCLRNGLLILIFSLVFSLVIGFQGTRTISVERKCCEYNIVNIK